eukprot:TRINITY_DN2881_c0_g1_i1.p1 TRINITY_DN2881_c0_g1~~TRINITY_DN2881_c0_g1_i1.p1  ORF type:complete len:1004 (+),score=276.61 TRINITY_DN2881_c0_g1_i1:34-3012(+)
MKGMVKWDDVDVTFEEFPYYLSDATKMALLDSTFIHLKRPEFAKYTADMPTMSPRILLTGPPGSETYQEALVKALAKHLQVKLLIFDSAAAYLEASIMTGGVPSSTSSTASRTLEDAATPLLSDLNSGGATQPATPPEASGNGGILEPDTAPQIPERDPPSSAAASLAQLTEQLAASLEPRPSLPPPPLPSASDALPPLRRSSRSSSSSSSSRSEASKQRQALRQQLHQSSQAAASAASAAAAAMAVLSSSLPSLPPLSDLRGASSSATGIPSQPSFLPSMPPLGTAPASTLGVSGSTLSSSTRADRAAALAAAWASSSLDPKLLSLLEGTKKAHPLRKGDRVRFVGSSSAAVSSALTLGPPSNGPLLGLKGRVLMLVEENPSKVGVRFDKPVFGGNNLADLCEDGHGYFCNVNELRVEGTAGEETDKMILDAFLEVVASEGSKEPLLVLVRSAERAVSGNLERFMRLERMEKMHPTMRMVVIGSHVVEARKEKSSAAAGAPSRLANLSALLDLSMLDQITGRAEDVKSESSKGSKMLAKVFPNKIAVHPPMDEATLRDWTLKLDTDADALRAAANRQRLQMILNSANMECEELSALEVVTQTLSQEAAERVVGWGTSHQLQQQEDVVLRNGKLLIGAESLAHGIKAVQTPAPEAGQRRSLKDVVCDNEFEKMLLAEVIPPDELGVSFEHIGALENVKETLRELVMLPLQRPELFVKGQLTKPVRGLLLFGPPGTGKTMLAKAVATEAGANFINVSMSSIASKWFGEAEKYVKAVFTLASKIAPSVIFIDEVDSMLSRRGKENEHSAMRKVKNELMSSWDGLRTRERERVLVLAATNRPFDLDEAVIRRFPRRLMVDLPDAENRAKILQVILADEDLAPDFRVEEMAASTDGYSGSDLKNLCTTAAYRRIKEILDKEKKEREKAKAEGREPPPPGVATPYIRPLDMEDMRLAMEKVRSSVATEASSMLELTQWNEQYGEGGTRKTTPLSYFM